MMNPERIYKYTNHSYLKGPVIYWMSRDQRVHDNWALIHSMELSMSFNEPLLVVFCLLENYPGANIRHFSFLMKGLVQVEENLRNLNIPFFLLKGNPQDLIPEFIIQHKAGILITDFDPLKHKMKWKNSLAEEIRIPFHEVDAHNIVPCRIASNKAEFGAYTIRPKIKKLLPLFLEPFPEMHPLKKQFAFLPEPIIWENEIKTLLTDRSIRTVEWIKPGEKEALKVFREFLLKRLNDFDEKRNDPNENAVSDLSPFFHFGHISAQRVAMEITKLPRTINTESFLEEMIVRRELADNFCFYNPDYDKFNGFPEWAKKTLNEHRRDEREFIYIETELENAKTHDPLWNAAQKEMVMKGKMHGYMRMYWAKKILEWTSSPEEALRISLYLNDKYELDGRDPNGYAGCAWSIGGVHDRAWSERPVYGKIRYMNYNGCKRKFDVNKYIENN